MFDNFLFPSGRGHYHRNRKKENLITWLVAVLVVAGLLGWNYINRKASDKTASEFDIKRIKDSRKVKEMLSDLVEKQRVSRGVTIREEMAPNLYDSNHNGVFDGIEK